MWTEYTWIVVSGAFLAVFVAYGIGANDVANAFGSSVGSRAITIKQAIIIAAVFEFAGAVLLGASVTKTVRKGIAYYWDFMDTPELYMYGMLCVLLATGIWLILASYWELPVSTTHSTVGGIIGMTMAAYGPSAVNWAEPSTTFPYVKGVAAVVASWIISPVLSGILSAFLFWLTRLTVLRSDNSYNRSFIAFPVLVFFTVFVNTFFILFKGAEGKINRNGEDVVEFSWALFISLGTGGGSALIVGLFLMPLLKRKIDRDYGNADEAVAVFEGGEESAAQVAAMAVNSDEEQGKEVEASRTPSTDSCEIASAAQVDVGSVHDRNLTDNNLHDEAACPEGASGASEESSRTPSRWSALGATLTRGMNVDVHSAAEAGGDFKVAGIHGASEKFDPKTEESFKYLQVFTAICDSFSHGANDVANSIGPFAAIWAIYQNQGIEKKSEVPVWILAMGGLGIVLGLATYGYKIMAAIGVKMCRITASRGYAIELGAAIVIILGSRLGIPLSTTHCQVGATVAVGLLEGNRGVNWPLVWRVAVGWVVTLLVVGLTAAMFFAQGAYAPSKPNLMQMLEYQHGIEANVQDMLLVLGQPYFTQGPNGEILTVALDNITQALFELSDTQNVYAVQELTLLNYTLSTYMLATTPLEQLKVVADRFGDAVAMLEADGDGDYKFDY